MDPVEELLTELNKGTHNQDPNWLSDTAIKLSSLLYYHNTETARAELDENKAAVNILDASLISEKKISATEAEKRALVETNNEYGKLKLQGVAIVEAIQSIKKKVDFLINELKNG